MKSCLINYHFLKSFVLSLIMTLVFIPFNGQCLSADKTPVILDADTGNEVDDPYAIVQALLNPEWQILALNAVQWQTSHWAVPQSMENSHRLNQTILGYMDLSIKTCRGGVARMFDWGDQAQHSAAAYEIIKQAHAMPSGKKLTIIALGALTNVASAIYIDPSIEPQLCLYWLGSSYDFNTGIMHKTDFNCVMDIQALEIMLGSSVEMHIMPHTVAAAMEFNFTETVAALKDRHPLGDFLVNRWARHLDNGRKHRVIWDLALVQAMIHPEWTEQTGPVVLHDYAEHPVYFYKTIQADKMKQDFFNNLQLYFKRSQ